ncbi:unnamed protein product, partial [Phaeothamnion confervicola]
MVSYTTRLGADLRATMRLLVVQRIFMNRSWYVVASEWNLTVAEPKTGRETLCIEVAEPSIKALLSDPSLTQRHTLFATPNEAFGASASRNEACADAAAATRLVQYQISTLPFTAPYIGQVFPTLADGLSLVYYGLAKTPDVRPGLYPIRFVNNANVTANPVPVATGDSLVPIDRLLQHPSGTIWDVIQADPSFTQLARIINGTTRVKGALSDATGAYTFFAPDDSAYRAILTGRNMRHGDTGGDDSGSSYFGADAAAAAAFEQAGTELDEIKYAFHAVAKGTYPRSLCGRHFSQQLFRTEGGGVKSHDYYDDFYQQAFTGAYLESAAGPPLNVTRLPDGTLLIEGVPVTEPDIMATNGVIHRLGGVMRPPGALPAVVAAPPPNLSAAGRFT